MGLVINHDKIDDKKAKELISLCPFKAFEYKEGKLSITAACKGCKLCVKKGPKDAITYIDETTKSVDKSLYNGVAVFCEIQDGKIHPVTLELLSKAKELANEINHEVLAVLIGYNCTALASELLSYGADKIYLYDDKGLENFKIMPYSNAFYDFIEKIKPSSILVGATNLGRSLAPRVAARCGTGLTADCTVLKMKENTDLVQIRPAFGGNIMAQIITPNTRPQFCTVRYKVFSKAEKTAPNGEIIKMPISSEMLKSNTEILETTNKPKEIDISEAEVIVAIGRAFKKESDVMLAKEFAELIGAQIAGTRPIIEAGFLSSKRQIGLSGRTVKPKIIITLGVSGSVQFVAGMKSSDLIVSINKNKDATIFDVSQVGIVGDVFEILPSLIEKIKGENSNV